MTAEVVLWRRPDTNELLRFSRSTVQSILVGYGPSDELLPSPQPLAAGRVPATVKLPGDQWLFGDVTSGDGQSFLLQLADAGRISIPRPKIEWLQFNESPSPAFAVAGAPLDLSGWLPSNASAHVQEGRLIVTGSSWIGHWITPPKRFEIQFELPEGEEEGTRLWLKPYSPVPNWGSRESVEVLFGNKEISRLRFDGNFVRDKGSLPPEAQAEKGPMRYRIFFDGIADRMLVSRNGRLIVDWKPAFPKGHSIGDMAGISFSNWSRDGTKLLTLNQVRIRPWDGNETTTVDENKKDDVLGANDAAPERGALTSIGESELTFSGKHLPREAGIFVTFGDAAIPTVSAEAKLRLESRQGEIKATRLTVHDGKLRCETDFAGAVEIPLKALQTITFTEDATSARPALETLVFKNGDELPGQALAAGPAEPIRWKTMAGQEVDIQSARVAGLRFGPSRSFTNVSPIVELRSGERLYGKVPAMNGGHLQLQSEHFGMLPLDGSQLWRLYPQSRFSMIDGGCNSNAWMKNVARAEGEPHEVKTGRPDSWVSLDGIYVHDSGSRVVAFDEQAPGLEREIGTSPDRIEARLDAAYPGDRSFDFTFRLSNPEGGPSLEMRMSERTLQLGVLAPSTQARPKWHEISLENKLPTKAQHLTLRLFVDFGAGACDVFVNGSSVAHFGEEPGERLPKAKYSVQIQPAPNLGAPDVFSNIWIGPWNGELPKKEDDAHPSVALINGDVVRGTPRELRDGTLIIDSELGELKIPVEKIVSVDFGTTRSGDHAAGRVRLHGGDILHLDDFHWDGRELIGRSPLAGSIRLKREEIAELVFDPAPLPPRPTSETNKAVPPGRGKLGRRLGSM